MHCLKSLANALIQLAKRAIWVTSKIFEMSGRDQDIWKHFATTETIQYLVVKVNLTVHKKCCVCLGKIYSLQNEGKKYLFVITNVLYTFYKKRFIQFFILTILNGSSGWNANCSSGESSNADGSTIGNI